MELLSFWFNRNSILIETLPRIILLRHLPNKINEKESNLVKQLRRYTFKCCDKLFIPINDYPIRLDVIRKFRNDWCLFN
jgi:hypothetical protein